MQHPGLKLRQVSPSSNPSTFHIVASAGEASWELITGKPPPIVNLCCTMTMSPAVARLLLRVVKCYQLQTSALTLSESSFLACISWQKWLGFVATAYLSSW